MLFKIEIFKICIYIQVSIQYLFIGAVPLRVPFVVVLLAPELYINPIIVVSGDRFKIKFVALVVIMHTCKPYKFVVVVKYSVRPEYGVIAIPNAVLVAVIKDNAVV